MMVHKTIYKLLRYPHSFFSPIKVQLPNLEKPGTDGTDAGGYGGAESRISIIQKINHDGEVNR